MSLPVSDDDDKSFFETLPDELILKILSHLSQADLAHRAPLVCRRLRALSLDPSLWSRVGTSLTLQSNEWRDKVDRLLLQGRHVLRELHLVDRSSDDNAADLAILALRRCCRLEELRLPGVTPDLLRAITEHGRSLRSLSVTGLGLRAGMLVENADCLDKLTSLTLPGWLTPGDLVTVADRCKNLQEFSLNQKAYRKFDADTVRYFLKAVKTSIRKLHGFALSEDVGECLLLETLEVNWAVKAGSALQAISKLPRLHHLLMRTCDFTRQDFVRAFADNAFPSLGSLHLIHCDGLDDLSLRAIAQRCPQLTSLGLWGGLQKVTDVGMRDVIRRCSRLQDLMLVGLTEMAGKALEAVPELLKDLKSLHVGDCPYFDRRFSDWLQGEMPNCHIIQER